ncbi:MAG: hypothetical protein JSS49_07380 [Planctomycetes bacterium]|nr:hypothetical protein [Planctomycetota bacterium]
MSVGLDLGTTELRSIRDSGGDLISRRCRASYLVLRDTSGHRRLLESFHARHGTCGDDLVVFGDDADECGSMLDVPAIPLLRDGRLPTDDPVARQILALMVEAVLPVNETPGAICCMTVPGGYGLEGDTQSLDVRFLKQLVALRGYTPQLISSGHAVVLAELSNSSFSGLGISLGATNCEVSVNHCGRELAVFTVPGELIDLDAADQRGAWERNCLRVLTTILTEAREALDSEGSIRLIQHPVSIACTGGITASEGFARLFQQAWHQSGWPLQVAQVRIATNPRFCIARGGLIKAILVGRPVSERRVA